MKRTLITAAIIGSLAVASAAAAPSAPGRPCSNIPKPCVSHARVLSVSSAELRNHTVAASPPILNAPVAGVNVCEVNVTLTHPGANDKVTVQVWLPLDGTWNGRFLSAGGSAWAAGHGPLTLGSYAVQGFAAASTDAGLPQGSIADPSAWALQADGHVNAPLLTNFASRSIHDMAIVGKAVTASYYGRRPTFSYWEGCSTGGRQGMVAAQQYPGDFDGILAAAPAIYWTKYVVAELWPQVVMKEQGYYPSACELAGVRADAVAVCDQLDGVRDGVISDPEKCRYDPSQLLGKTLDCGNGVKTTVGPALVAIAKKIWDGPKTAAGSRLWYGLPVGAPFDTLAATQVNNGTRVGVPFFVAQDWARYFVEANPKFDVGGLDSDALRKLFDESVREFAGVIDSSSPDLSRLKKAGGKLLVWHGGADNVIFPQATAQYYDEVAKSVGGGLDGFFRLFFAPGVDHCAGGSIDGAAPTDALGSLIAWVEKGEAPQYLAAATLPTAKTYFTRKLCPYPLMAKYDGHRDPSDAASYQCGRS